MSNQQATYLKDYKKPSYLIKTTQLHFDILEDRVIVKSKLHMQNNEEIQKSLVLNGDDLLTKAVIIDGKVLKENADYRIENNNLTISNVPSSFILETEVEINPFTNTKLMGIYKSSSCICSQCEPEGFRRITWFLDRPDVMSVWSVSISADVNNYETLLSNGNKVKEEIVNNRRTCYFHDICPKPSYLFAFVAGNFDVVSGIFKTMTGRGVDLNVFVEKGKKDQAYFALESLQRAMKWDEETYKLEYELDIFSIVAVSDFNFGAMENKSLNIFNDAYVLAKPEIATDDDYFGIESVVAHEYFHNFTGDRITCRDWFQLTLKEGLTVFRDHRFSEDHHNRDIVRINEVERFRNYQFPEDASPLAHPIRPLSYIEMNNFYTTTVYDKGAEVIRMIETIIGEANFKKGIDTYFANFDGQAVTCEEFLWSMEQAGGISLENFKRWYLQSGTPIVDIATTYNSSTKELTLKLKQTNKPTPKEPYKHSLVIPLRIALFDNMGTQLDLTINGKEQGKECVIILEDDEQEFIFSDMPENVSLTNIAVSVNRRFSAPVIINFPQNEQAVEVLIKYDTDGFAKFEALQTYLKKYMISWIDALERGDKINDTEVEQVVRVYKDIINAYNSNLHLTALVLRVPTFVSFEIIYKENLPIESIYEVISILENAIAITYESKFLEIFHSITDKEDIFNAQMMAKRVLKNRCLYYLVKTKKQSNLDLLSSYYKDTKNMTKRMACLISIKDFTNTKEHKEIFNSFYKEYKDYPTVLNKWFVLSASIVSDETLDTVKDLLQLDTFSYSNPNKVRSVIGSFVGNHLSFHKLNGEGYKFLEENIIKLDSINPSISAGLAKVFAKIMLHKPQRQKLMLTVVQNILKTPNISKGLREILEMVKK